MMNLTKKARVIRALRGEPVDRPPVSFWHHDQECGEENAQAHLKFYRSTNLDFIKIMYDGLGAPFDLDLRTIGDLEKIRSAELRGAYAQGILERAKRVNDLLGGEVHTYFNLFSPFCLLRRLGDDAVAELLRQDRGAVIAALERTAQGLARIEEELLRSCGCLGLFLCFQGAEKIRFSREDFDEIVRPSDMAFLEAANREGEYNIAHFCAWDGNPNDLQLWRDYPARAVNWAIYVDGMTLPEGRAFFGGRTVLGGFDNRRGTLLYTGTREEIEAETRRIVADYRTATGSTDGLIIGADCSFLPPVDTEHFNWVAQALE